MDLTSIPRREERRTGRCYELAFKFLLDNKSWSLLQAMTLPPVGPWAGKEFDHAFVELGEVVFDPVFDPVFAKFFPTDEFYKVYGVTDPRKYDHATAVDFLLKEKHYGPWIATSGEGHDDPAMA